VIFVDHGISAAPGVTVWAAIRPEKIRIARERPQQPDNVIEGTIKEIAYMGDMSIYLVQIDTGRIVRVTLPNSERDSVSQFTWDERVFLHWHAESPVVVTQ
jgi:putrescine transport system ATP-binding protein